MLKTCPDPVDVQDIQFKLHCSLKVFDNHDLGIFPNKYSLVSCASRYGLIFVGTSTASLKVIQSKIVENYNPKDKDILNFTRRNIPLPSVPKHVCVNCDSSIVAVVVEVDNCSSVLFYDVLSFYKQNISIIKEVRLSSTPGVYATEVNWNPALPNIFTACKSDGALGNYEFKDNTIDINEIPPAAECTSFCWSPKGKQIAVGSKKGTITQYKPDLKAVKVINSPTFQGIHSLISLCWVSNYQFIGVYQAANEDGLAKLVVVDAPKSGETSYTNYDDHWNMLMVASSNSTELGLLGSISEIWTQWNVPDFARAELPIGADQQDTLPVGIALDISNTKPLPWGEGAIPPAPYLLMLSHQGVLYFFNIVNLKGMPSICCPSDAVTDMSGLGQFVVEANERQPISIPQAQPNVIFDQPQQQLHTKPQNFQTTQPTLLTGMPQTSFSFAKPTPTQSLPAFGSLQSSTPPTTALFSKPSDTKPLFGSQITLTPIKPQQPAPSSLFENASITLTPISKPQGGEKYSSIFAALKEPSAIPIADPKPIVISTHNITPESPVNDPLENLAKETSKAVIPELARITVDAGSVDEKIKKETEVLLAKMVKDECEELESELKALLHQGRRININIGSEQEKIDIVRNLQDLQEFIKEVVDISLQESAEVHALKQNLILSWAWYEEALSRYNISKDETMALLIKSQPLDSAAEKRQSDIRKSIYYLESQLYQASEALDEQWDKFQDYAKKTYKVQMPTMEAIFQSMVRQNAILQKQSYILKDISNRIKHKKVITNTPSLFLSFTSVDNLEEDLSRLQLDPDSGHKIVYEQSLDQAQKFSVMKRSKLRELLKVRSISHVTAAKPQLNSSISLFKSPISKSKHIFSILGARMSPVAKPSVIKNIQFSESTPIKLAQEINPTSVPPNTPAQLDTLKSFTFKESVPSPPTFVTVPKSGSLSVNQTSSAFVPAIPTSKVFLVPSTSVTSTTSNLFFNLSGSGISVTPSEKKPDLTFSSAGTSGTAFNFGGSANIFTPKTEIGSSVSTGFSFASPASAISLPSSGTDTAQNLFSFNKTIGVSPASTSSSIIKSTPSINPAHISSTPQTFSFGKNTSSVGSAADSTNKLTLKTATKPALFSTSSTPISSDAAILASPIPLPISKPINFGLSETSNNSKVTSSLQTTSTFVSEASPKTTTSLYGAVTTTTTSLFGSIATPSLARTKPSLPSSITVTPIIDPTKSTSSLADTSTTPKSIDLVTSASATMSKPLLGKTPAPTPIINIPIFGTSATAVSSTKPLLAPDMSSATTSSIFSSPNAASISNSGSIFSASSISTPPVTTSPSLFSSTSTKTPSSIFANPSSSSSIFGGTMAANLSGGFINTTPQGQKLNSPISQPLALDTSAASTSIFSSNVTSSSPSIFGNSKSSPPPLFSSPSVTTQASIFSASPATSKIGTSTTSSSQLSIFGSNATTAPVFGSPTTTTPPSIFGNSNTPSAFGSTAVKPQTPPFGISSASTSPVFGGTSTSTPASNFVAGTVSTASTSAPIFGTTPIASQAPVFGSATTSAPSIFGTTTTQSSIFGSQSTPSESIFGSASPVSSTQSSIFGQVKPASNQTSIFGSVSPVSTQSSIFGSANPAVTQPSIFGSATSSTNSVFGAASNSTPAFGSSFGQSGSIFGNATTTGSTFGSSTNFAAAPTTTAAFSQQSAFGSNTGSVFGTPTTSNNIFGSSNSAFGGVSTSGNVFASGNSSSFSFASAGNSLGFGDLNVGSTPASGGSIFGGSPTFGQTTSNPFAKATDQKSPFSSSSSGSIFGSNTGNTFGSNTQTAFGSPPFGSSPGFGQQPAFGQNIGSNSSFGAASQSGPFSTGGAGVGQTGFGSSSGFQKNTGAFGAAPVFGGSPQPAFGASPSFGGAPAFGNSASFGSPTKVFGSPGTASTFGQTSGNASSGFGNLATQNTVGFGNLAQQAATSTSTPFSGNSSFSSWR